MTIGKFYQKAVRELKAAGIKTAELDAKVLLKFVLENDETFLLMHPEMPLTNYQFSKLKKLLKRRLNNEPIAYLTGHKEFFGHDFLVNHNVLIPRPESENLVEQALDRIKNTELRIKPSDSKIKKSSFNILDIGTGSGCMIISLALELEKLTSLPAYKLINLNASDISKKALTIAKKNAAKYDVKNKIKFYHSDLFTNRLLHKKYDLIIANLPYVPLPCHPREFPLLFEEGLGVVKMARGSKQHNFLDSRFHGNDSDCLNDSIDFEPADSIFADDNGTAVIKKFLTETKNYLNINGLILLELDPRNAADIQKFAIKNYPNSKIELKKDLAKLDRYLMIEN